MLYRCVKCKEEFELGEKEPVRCQMCGFRILVKVRPPFRKKVKAI